MLARAAADATPPWSESIAAPPTDSSSLASPASRTSPAARDSARDSIRALSQRKERANVIGGTAGRDDVSYTNGASVTAHDSGLHAVTVYEEHAATRDDAPPLGMLLAPADSTLADLRQLIMSTPIQPSAHHRAKRNFHHVQLRPNASHYAKRHSARLPDSSRQPRSLPQASWSSTAPPCSSVARVRDIARQSMLRRRPTQQSSFSGATRTASRSGSRNPCVSLRAGCVPHNSQRRLQKSRRHPPPRPPCFAASSSADTCIRQKGANLGISVCPVGAMSVRPCVNWHAHSHLP